MQTVTFLAKCPYELGDKLQAGVIDGMLVINHPKIEQTAEIVITDILTIHSLKRQSVEFFYEIYGDMSDKKWKIIDWKDVQFNEHK